MMQGRGTFGAISGACASWIFVSGCGNPIDGHLEGLFLRTGLKGSFLDLILR